MRIRVIPEWRCGAWAMSAALCCPLVCFAAPALAQSIDASQDASSTVSDASPSEIVNAAVNANLEGAGASGSARGSGSAKEVSRAGFSTLAGSSRVVAYSHAIPASRPYRGGAHVLAREFRQGKRASAGPGVSGWGGYDAARALKGSRGEDAARARIGAALGSGSAATDPNGATQGARYSAGFEDSTRGTALVSPPDLGTAGPFDFSPGMSFGLPDFADQQFLSPSLNAGAHAAKKGRRDRRTALHRTQTPTAILPDPFSASPDSDLGLDALRNDLDQGQRDLNSDLDTSVPASTNPH